METGHWVEELRKEFPGLSSAGQWILCDSPGGTQVHQDVISAVSAKMSGTTANLGMTYPSAMETVRGVARAREVVATFLNCSPGEVVFGANMTSITNHLARSVGRTLSKSDNVLLTSLDHDANVTPWKLVAEEHGAEIRVIDFNPTNCCHDLDKLETYCDKNTRLVAIGAAANSCGTLTDIKEVVAAVKRASAGAALVYVDAVHLAPHRLIDVKDLGCDFLVCSSYKFCGPHAGILYGRETLLRSLTPHKLSACTDLLPGPASCQASRWETGTASFEAIAGIQAAVEYIASLGVRTGLARPEDSLRTRLEASYQVIKDHEHNISELFLTEARTIPGLTVHGLTEVEDISRRTPTFSLSMEGLTAQELASSLVARGLLCGAGHFYALGFPRVMDLERNGGYTRIGFVHYNTMEEVRRVVTALSEVALERPE